MSPIGLLLLLLVALALRLLFIGVHLSDPGSLWADYDRCGLKYRLAQCLDWITLGGFAIPVFVLLFRINQVASPLIMTFVGFFGIQLLSRLRTSRFPRTNLAGAFTEAKIDLIVHLLMSLLGAASVTLLTAVYLWFRS